MSTIEEVKTAEERMKLASAALMGYVERPASAGTDTQLHMRLADELKAATDEFLRFISELGR